MLLGRPTAPRTETVNDLDCFVSNFWRAIAHDPDAVAAHADWPVNEADLHARHRWLVNQAEFRSRMRSEPDFYDARIAGWWVWGISMWIGGGWCSTRDDPLENGETPSEQEKRPRRDAGAGVHATSLRRPHLGGAGDGSMGVHRHDVSERLPKIGGNGQGSNSIGRLRGAAERGPAAPYEPSERKPHLGAPGSNEGGMRGVHRASLTHEKKPYTDAGGRELHARRLASDPPEQLPFVGNRGRGVLRPGPEASGQIPQLTGRGMDSHAAARSAPAASGPGLSSNTSLGVLGPLARTRLVEEFVALAARLRDVRVCCGDWSRVLTPAVTTGHGLTGILLDPPYSTKERASGLYAHDGPDVSEAVRVWALENGDDPLLRIVLCGYEGEHAMPKGWRVVEWKAHGGFGAQRKDKSNQNSHRERLWLSPHCVEGQRSLFA